MRLDDKKKTMVIQVYNCPTIYVKAKKIMSTCWYVRSVGIFLSSYEHDDDDDDAYACVLVFLFDSQRMLLQLETQQPLHLMTDLTPDTVQQPSGRLLGDFPPSLYILWRNIYARNKKLNSFHGKENFRILNTHIYYINLLLLPLGMKNLNHV